MGSMRKGEIAMDVRGAALNSSISSAGVRGAFRSGVVRPTRGIARGYAQANMIMLSREYSYNFLSFT